MAKNQKILVLAVTTLLAGMALSGCGQQTNTESQESSSNSNNLPDGFSSTPYFDPKQIVVKESENKYADATNDKIESIVGTSSARENHYRIYEFEGKYCEAYQGDTSFKYAYLYCWDDGLYNGSCNGTNYYGWWYNVDDFGKDCLDLVATDGNDMVCDTIESDYYDWTTSLITNINGGRAVLMSGFYFTPIIGIEVNTSNATTDYVYSQSFDETGLEIDAVRADGRVGAIIDTDNVKYGNPDMLTIGKQDVTVNYGEFSSSFLININALDHIAIDSSKATTVYGVGDSLNITGLIITGYAADGTEVNVDASQCQFSSLDSTTTGDKTITVTVGGTTGTFNVSVAKTTYSFDDSADTIKKNYRLVDRFDSTGIVASRTIGDVANGGRTETIDVSQCSWEFDIADSVVKITLGLNEVEELPVTFDTTAASNTIVGTVDEKAITIVVTSLTTASITYNGASAVAAIEISGDAGLGKFVKGSKISGDDLAFNALPAKFSLKESDSVISMVTMTYYRSSTKANAYSQNSDTFFMIGADPTTIVIVFTFSYQGIHNEYMVSSDYTFKDNKIVVNSVTTDSENQWQWCNHTFSNVSTCEESDLPFVPSL